MTSFAPPKSMPPRKPYPLDWVDPNKMHAGLVDQANKTFRKKYPDKPIQEVEDMKHLPYLTKVRTGTKHYHEVARVVYALKVGLVNVPDVMPASRATLLKRHMMEKFRFTEDQVNDFLTRKFTTDERMELYKRLSDNFNPDNDGLKCNAKDIHSALWSFSGSGFSLLCKVWVEPPKRKVIQINVNLSPELQHVCKMMAEDIGAKPTDYNVIKVVRAMSTYFDRELRPYHEARFEHVLASFGEFVAGYQRFLDDYWPNWKDRHLSWRDFEVTAEPFGEWADEWKADIDYQVHRRNERAREEQAEREQYQRDYEDTMRGLNW